jgi:peroxiredoxin Q/BCP
MEAYRDQYATLFNNGRNVVVIGISVDPDTALASWAHDEDFPVLFASDVTGQVGALYGAYLADHKVDNRSLFVVGPDGRITYRVSPFNVLSSDAYSELTNAVKATLPAGEGDGS